ncbi:PEP-CTERM sorting domain-containing protein [Paucibacter sp. APW11]|uniref:PEP-CTERM sorting domain-containing protein n=1 Tax=Roseateles aquae TaxID=3077235 RepID=A0ABU3PCU4_9BURK|nr:PEP-CTERM sorting domain-containing protein [Paucibacter sp. APW11]MDT9000414.1 PEP-CTERM sorting domain-containing protein [Paucibacter sp. APW11]
MRKQAALTSILALAAFTAQADATLSFSAGVENGLTQQYAYLDSSALPPTLNSGLQHIATSDGSATLQAWANPNTGAFKSIVTASVGSGLPTSTAYGYASFNLSDTLRFSGPGDTVQVSFTLSHDSVLSGMDQQQFSAYQLIDHLVRAGSNRSLSLNYTIANPSFDPNATCIDYGSDGMYCPPETQQTLNINENANSDVSGQVEYQRNGQTGARQVVRFGLGDGHYTATDTYVFTLPTNVDISLGYRAWTTAECYHMANCTITSDASHSDYLGLNIIGAGSFASSSQYQYLGLAAAVPEPSSAVLAFGGLVGLLAWRRRQGKSA